MTRLPARRSGLLTRSVGAETVVYDDAAAVAHSLSPLATAVFGLCDGRTSLAVAAASLSVAEADVETAVTTLVSLGLVEATGMTRRSAMQKAGLVGAGALAVTIAAPLAAAHATATATGGTTTTYDLYTIARSYGSGPQSGPYTFFEGAFGSAPSGFTQVTTPAQGQAGQTTTFGYRDTSGQYQLPVFFTTDGTNTYSAEGDYRIPPSSFGTHPGTGTTAAAVAFTNPGTTSQPLTFNVQATHSTAPETDGNGVGVTIVDGTGATIAGGGRQLIGGPTFPASATFTATVLSLAPGATVYILIDNNGDVGSDGTVLAAVATLG